MRIERPSIGSTQTEAIARVRAGAPEGLTIVAHRQELGLGRRDHAWSSPDGGLYLSTVARDPGGPAGLVPIGIGAGLAEAIARDYGVRTLVKWPNDVLAGANGSALGKLAGILVDRIPSPTFGTAFVVGVGVNVASRRRDLPEAIAGRAAILSELVGRPIAPSEVEPLVLDAVRSTVERLGAAGGAEAIAAAGRARLFGVGRRVRIDGRPAGTLRTIADDGALLVDRGGAVEAIRSGELLIEEGT